MSDKPQFNIGDEVFVAEAHAYARVEIPCPICFGKKSVQLILGNGEIESIDCDGCGLGFNGPRGVICASEATSKVYSGVVTGVSCDRFNGGWKYEVGGRGVDACDIFADKDAAEQRRIVLFDEAKRARDVNLDSQLADKKKSHAWHVRHHRDAIKRAEREIQWHEERLHRHEDKEAGKKTKEVKP